MYSISGDQTCTLRHGRYSSALKIILICEPEMIPAEKTLSCSFWSFLALRPLHIFVSNHYFFLCFIVHISCSNLPRLHRCSLLLFQFDVKDFCQKLGTDVEQLFLGGICLSNHVDSRLLHSSNILSTHDPENLWNASTIGFVSPPSALKSLLWSSPTPEGIKVHVGPLHKKINMHVVLACSNLLLELIDGTPFHHRKVSLLKFQPFLSFCCFLSSPPSGPPAPEKFPDQPGKYKCPQLKAVQKKNGNKM